MLQTVQLHACLWFGLRAFFTQMFPTPVVRFAHSRTAKSVIVIVTLAR